MSLAIYQSIRDGAASGFGSTYWGVATSCGRKLALRAANAGVKESSAALRAGTYFHKLKELWWTGSALPSVVETGEVEDADWAEAVRCFNKDIVTRPKESYGTVLGVEVPLPFDDEHRNKIKTLFSGEDYEGRIDILVEWTDAQAFAYGERWGIPVRGGGIYNIDYKLLSKKMDPESASAYDYTRGMQGICYSTSLRLALGDRFKGTIFEVTTKTKDVGSQALFMPWDESMYPIAQAYIKQAVIKRELGHADPSACFDGYRLCPFLVQGLCNRY